jgi:hypothetical protein
MRMIGKELRELNWLYDLAYNVVNNENKEYTDNAYKYVKQKLKELTKYKRAFEILKDLVIFDKKNQAVANGTNIIDLSKEESELLEELINNESR